MESAVDANNAKSKYVDMMTARAQNPVTNSTKRKKKTFRKDL
jgi:hypothetical protein